MAGKEAIEYAIVIDAMTLMGEMIKAAEKNKGAKGTGSNQHKKQVRSPEGTAPPTPAEVGITKKESSDAGANPRDTGRVADSKE